MFPDRRQMIPFRLKTADLAAPPADNEDLAVFMIPAGCEIEIQNMKGYVESASDTSTDSIELVDESDSVLCQLVIGATGKVSAKTAASQSAEQTFPIRLVPQSNSVESLLKLRANGAMDATTTVNLQLHISGLAAKAHA